MMEGMPVTQGVKDSWQGLPEALAYEEYRGWRASLHHSEELGERRIQFFVGFVTAVLGGMLALVKRADGTFDWPRANRMAEWTLPVLLLIGLATFMRMLRRNEVTDRCKTELAKIRYHFGHHDPQTTELANGQREPRKLLRGGLAVMMLVLESLLAAGWWGLPRGGQSGLQPGYAILGFFTRAVLLYVI